MIDKSKVILVKSYSELSNRLLLTLDEVPTWQSPRIDSSASITVRGSIAKTNLDSWHLEIANSEVDSYIRDNTPYIINQANKFFEANPDIKITSVYFDQFWDVLCYIKEGSKVTTYVSSTTRDTKYIAMTLYSVGRALDTARHSSLRMFTYLIGDTILSSMVAWPLVAVSVMVVNTFLDENIPAVEDVDYKEVTYDGFKLTFNYVSKLLGDNSPSDWNVKQLYDKYVERKWMPHVPITWNKKEIELMKTKEIRQVIDEYTAKVWGVKDPPEVQLITIDDEVDVDSALPVPETVESTTSPVEEVTKVTLPPLEKEQNPFEIGSLNLSAIMDDKNPAIIELSAVFPNDFFACILPVILDVPVKVGRLGLKTKNILACILDCGVIMFVVKKGAFSLPQLSEIRKRFDEQYMTTSVWIDESHRDAHNYINLYQNWLKVEE